MANKYYGKGYLCNNKAKLSLDGKIFAYTDQGHALVDESSNL